VYEIHKVDPFTRAPEREEGDVPQGVTFAAIQVIESQGIRR
jgi:hypothetical protein